MKRFAVLVGLLAVAAGAYAAPVALWVSDPVRPGDTVLVFGDGFAKTSGVTVYPATGGRALAAPIVQARERSLKFLLPAALPTGPLYADVRTPQGAVRVAINRPAILWAQGDQGTAGSPGGFVRLVGRCLQSGKRPADVWLSAVGRSVLLKARRTELFTAEAALPARIAPGQYRLSINPGGRDAGWSDSVPFTVVALPAAPSRRVTVVPHTGPDEGADATAAVQHALDDVGRAGGGTVYLPRGRYVLSSMLTVPPGVTLQGEGTALTALCWTETDAPPEALIKGTHGFTIRDLTVYSSTYRHGIVADQDAPGAGHVRILRVRVRIDPYRGHLTAEEVNRRFVEAQKLSTGGGDSLRLGGTDVEVAGCDIYGGGRCLFLLNTRGGWLHDNAFYNGRWGWYCITGSDGLVFERNSITGADLMSTGGGINDLGSNASRNVYYADNHLEHMFGWDREAMTTDAGGGAYFGKVASAHGTRISLAEDAKWDNHDWKGAGLFLLDGKGQGQFRRIVSFDGRDVDVDRPWTIAPDTTTVASITMVHENYLFVGNTFEDAGVAIQMYGTSIGNIAYRNVSARTGGFHNFGMNYYGIQPSWYTQWLENRITEGNVYGGGHDQSIAVGEAHLGVFALPPGGSVDVPMTLCGIIRGNRLDNNAHLAAGGSDPPNPSLRYPYTQDVIVEHNRVENAQVGLVVARSSLGVTYRDNTFVNCAAGVVDDRADDKLAEMAYAKLAAQPGPLLHLTFDKLEGDTFRDVTGHGFDALCHGTCRVASDGVRGACLRLDGKSYLTVARPRVLRPESFTLSVWMRTEDVSGRWGILSKRFGSAETPFVLGETNGGVTFEATDSQGAWSFNVQTSPTLTPGVWHHLAAVMRKGEGVIVYADGKEVGRRANAAELRQTADPLVIGHEAWGGRPPDGHTPAFYTGDIDDVQIFPRALTAEEVAKLAAR